MRRLLAFASLVVLVLAVSSAPAGANYTGNFDTVTGVVTLTGDGASDKLAVSRNPAGDILFDVGDDGTTENLTPGSTPTVANVARIDVNGLGGDDQIRANEANGALPAFVLDGGGGADILTGGSGGDTIRGGEGVDTLLGKGGGDDVTGGDGDDTITPGNGDDVAGGDAGSDRIIWNPGDGTDTVEGGADRDTEEINGGNGAESFDVSPSGGRVVLARITPAPFSVSTSGVENAIVHANGGNDAVVGHSGLKDLISLVIEGGTGDDNLTGGDGDDRFLWRPGETITQDVVDGSAGNDRLDVTGDGTAEDFDATGGTTGVTVTRNGGQPNATDRVETIAIAAGDGDDQVRAANSMADRASLDLDLGTGSDVAIGGGAGDRIAGGTGDDILLGRGGDDALFGDAGTDDLIGGTGADQISCGGFGDDFGDDPADTIAADCRPPAPEPGPEPQPTTEPGPGGQAEGPAGDLGLPPGFLGFARPQLKGTLKALSVGLVNTHTAPITVSVAATESKIRYRTVTVTIAPGAKATVKLKVPAKLRKAIVRKLARRSKLTRKPVVSVTNVATGGKSTVTGRITARR
jgi:Ca2+-binding RTX toxin-like protein